MLLLCASKSRQHERELPNYSRDVIAQQQSLRAQPRFLQVVQSHLVPSHFHVVVVELDVVFFYFQPLSLSRYEVALPNGQSSVEWQELGGGVVPVVGSLLERGMTGVQCPLVLAAVDVGWFWLAARAAVDVG